MTKKEVEDMKDYVQNIVVKGIVIGIAGAIVSGLIAAIIFMIIAPGKLDAHENRIGCLESEVVLIRKDMNSNQKEILNILRSDYNVR